jgi:hypothetical protein
VPEVIGALPPEDRGAATGGSLPTSALSGHRSPGYGEGDGMLRGVADDDRVCHTRRAVTGLLDAKHTRSGQIAANARDRAGRRLRSPVVFWFDNPADGRYSAVVRAERHGEDWLTVTPAGYDHLVARLRECLAGIGAP